MRARILLFTCFTLAGFFSKAQNIPNGTTGPASKTARAIPHTPSRATDYYRTLIPVMPLTDSSKVRFSAPVDSIMVSTEYADGLGRPLESVAKQASPSEKDFIAPATYDDFGRPAFSYLPYTATTNNGQFSSNPFKDDSFFYKSQFPNEQINYGEKVYDGSPLNRVVKSMSPGNSWTGSGVGTSVTWRAGTAADSVRLWTINISSDNDVPTSSQNYQAGALMVQETTNESGIKTIVYKDELGRTILSKQQISSTVSSAAYTGWLCTYFVYDEMNHLRFVITPKATQVLVTLSWNLAGNPAIAKNLCYAYYYDALGRLVTKSLPDKGKIYMAYDSIGRVVLAQDSLLRTTSQWQYVKYDGQNRAIKAGLITLSGLSKDTVLARAARSSDYPTLTGTYSVWSEVYYDDYSWVASSGSGLGSTLSNTDINSTNFITTYNASPDYAQSLTQSKRTRGAITGTKIAVLGTSTFLYNVKFYDDHSRVIQTQSKNFSTGTDVSTTEYNFTSQPLRNFVRHQKLGNNSQTHTVLTKYSYDRLGGRLTTISKKADGQTETQIVSYTYNELGQMKTQTLGGNLETQNMAYNIQGSLLGINKNYAEATSDTSWFGEELSYDYGFTNNKLDGNIAGIRWRSKGDSEERAYGYTYDAAGRLTKADFSQNTSGWNTSGGVDYTVRNLSYDANGNILSMTQKGLKLNSSPIIDSLVYGYATNSNQLLYVTDKANDTTAHLGDFTEINNNTTQDYWYDGNGNFTKDNNKAISAIAYNFLNLPDTITVTGKGLVTYTYDAMGTKLQKKVTEGSKITTTTYINGFVYKNDTLAYALTEDGRIRPSVKAGQSATLVYDYFVKDHLGNIRMVLTAEKDTTVYPKVTFEDANISNEEIYYDDVDVQRTSRPDSFYTSSSNGSKVQLLRKSVESKGVGKLLKVMAGDKLDVHVDYYIPDTTITNNSIANGLNTIITALASVIDNSPVTTTLHGSGSTITNELDNSSPFTSFMQPQNGTTGTTLPKAYLNIIFFDNEFKFVSGESVPVTTEGSGQTLYRMGGNAEVAPKNGFAYIYLSNESDNLVYFDNLQVTHEHGPLLQENHYYPYGLGMAGISSSAITNAIPNSYKANGGSELGSNEWTGGSGLELYETTYRSFDAQIGRFMQVDPLMDSTSYFSDYAFGNDKPTSLVDPMGNVATAGYYDQGYHGSYSPNPFRTYTDVNGETWHGDDPLGGALDFMDSGDNGGGGGGGSVWASISGDYSAAWSGILAFANGDDAGGYVVDKDGKIISDPSNRNLLTVWLQNSSNEGQTSYEYLGSVGGVIHADKIISNLLHDNIIDVQHMSPHDFKQMVEDHGDWDFKRNKDYIYGEAAAFDRNNSKYFIHTTFLFKGYSMTAEDFGNFHYGVVGLANGNFTETMLFMAAGYVQIRDHNSRPEWQNSTYWGDDPNDHYWIQQGFNYYNSNY